MSDRTATDTLTETHVFPAGLGVAQLGLPDGVEIKVETEGTELLVQVIGPDATSVPVRQDRGAVYVGFPLPRQDGT